MQEFSGCVQPVRDRTHWDHLVNTFSGNPFQLWGWGNSKESSGLWEALRLVVVGPEGEPIGGAQVLLRKVPFPFKRIAYVPRGPFGESAAQELIANAVASHVKNETGAVAITFEPEVDTAVRFAPLGGVPSSSSVLLRDTVVLDLRKSTDDLLANMAKKTRSYVRRSLREGVSIRRAVDSHDIDLCLDIYDQTADRADFSLHDREYYRTIHRQLGGAAPAYLAFFEGRPVAFLWLIVSRETAVELYGGATELGLTSRANYALKWWVISDVVGAEVQRYDLNGLLDSGISQFKKEFSDHVDQYHAAVDIPLSPLYPLWATLLPRVRGWLSAVKGHIRRRRL